ncbi:MAG: GFA family protein [Pseudomonadota bacterium]
MTTEGGCYCGALRYLIEGKPIVSGQCHCRECQYISGGAPHLFLLMAEDGFAYTIGEPKLFQRSDLEAPVTREFCGTCGTHVATRLKERSQIVLKIGTLDDPTAFGNPQIAIYTCDKQPFHMVPEGMPAFETLPPEG